MTFNKEVCGGGTLHAVVLASSSRPSIRIMVDGAEVQSFYSNRVSTSWDNPSSDPKEVSIVVHNFENHSGTIDLDVFTRVDCPCERDDAREPDDRARATRFDPSGGLMTAGRIGPAGDDWFVIRLCPFATVTADARFEHTNGNVDVELLYEGTGLVVATGRSSTNDEHVTYTNPHDRFIDVYVRVFVDDPPFECNDYELQVVVDCPCIDDRLEEDDTYQQGTPVVPMGATYPRLRAAPNDPDWFSIEMCVRGTVTATATFRHVDGNVNLRLYDATGVLASSLTNTDDEVLRYTLGFGPAVTLDLEVTVEDPPKCPFYDLAIHISCPADSDGDGVVDLDEEARGTNPNLRDTDEDGLTDYEEFFVTATDPLRPDSDGDGLTDGREVNDTHTDPNLRDTDGGGLSDGEEVNDHPGNNPLDPNDDLIITTESLHDGLVGRDEAWQLHAVGGTGSYYWVEVSLPFGELNALSGLWEGTPESPGELSVTVRVRSGDLEAQKTLNVRIWEPAEFLTTHLNMEGTLVLSDLPVFRDARPPFSCRLYTGRGAGTKPGGVTLDGDTCTLSGGVGPQEVPGTYGFIVILRDAFGHETEIPIFVFGRDCNTDAVTITRRLN